MKYAIAVGCVCALSLAGSGRAETEGPMARTKQVLQRSHDIVLSDKVHKQKVLALNDLLRDFLDTDAMGREAMGKHLDGRSPGDVRAFLDVFHDLFLRTYVQRLLLFEAPGFDYRKEAIDGSKATVETEIVTPKDRFAVNYTMRKGTGGWRATDILVEDASLGDNFRSQFDSALAKESFDSLMGRLRKKASAPDKSEL